MLQAPRRILSVRSLPAIARQQVRGRSFTNTGILFVPQQEAWVIERFGKYHRTLDPGFNICIPLVDKIAYIQSLKEIATEVPDQSAITSDNVGLTLDGVLYFKVVDAYKASYGVAEAVFAVTMLAQTTMRSELGKISLDTVFREREQLNVQIVEAMNKATAAWGIDCKRYEIRDMKMPARIQEAMQMQVEAERKKRANILESEGIKTSDINVAEGKRQAQILASEAVKQEQINRATGEAEAILKIGKARADATRLVAEAIGAKDGPNAVSFNVAEQYIKAFGNLAKTGNTVLLPANAGDVGGMVAQAMTIYKSLSNETQEEVAKQVKEDK